MYFDQGLYTISFLATLAPYQAYDNYYVSLEYIASENNLSIEYLKKIAKSLKHHGLVDAKRGNSGGYRLYRALDKMSVYDVMSESGIIDDNDLLSFIKAKSTTNEFIDFVGIFFKNRAADFSSNLVHKTLSSGNKEMSRER